MRNTHRKWRNRLLIVGIFTVSLWLVASYAAADRLTQRGAPLHAEPAPVVAWGSITPVRLSTADGEQLGGWFIEGHADKPTVLILHGNGRKRSTCLKEAELVANAGCSVLLVTQRAHGDSTGDFNDFGFSARLDVIAAVEWLRARSPNRSIVVWGQSLGSAAALFAAAELGERVQGYILECPYQNLRTAVRNRTRMYLPPVLDFVAYSGFSAVAPAVLPNVDEISPLKAAANVPGSAKVLVLAGELDQRATPAEARKIAAVIGERATLHVVPGGDHLTLAQADPENYRRVVLGFLADLSR